MNFLKRLVGGRPPYWDLVKPYWETVNIYEGEGAFLRTFGSIPKASGHLLATHWCQSEVRNGGFEQFYMNNTGVLAPEAAAGFRALGMTRCADIMDEQIRAFGGSYPRDKMDRGDRLVAMEDAHFDRFPEGSEPDISEAGPLLNPNNKEFWALLADKHTGFEFSANRFAGAYA